MKSLLLSLLFSMLAIVRLDVQALYHPGDTTKGKNASYYCMDVMPNRIIRVRNIQNKDTLSNMYFEDGSMVPLDRWLGSTRNYEYSEFVQAFKDALTLQELNQLKTVRGSLSVNVLVDKAGNALELDFVFRKDNPVLSKFAPDRLFQLETKFKKILKLNISESDRKIKNLKFMVVITFMKDLK